MVSTNMVGRGPLREVLRCLPLDIRDVAVVATRFLLASILAAKIAPQSCHQRSLDPPLVALSRTGLRKKKDEWMGALIQATVLVTGEIYSKMRTSTMKRS
jgi:hypothetical protein